MKPAFDFTRPPELRRRQQELRFYKLLAAAALLGCLLAAVPALRLFLHMQSLRQANALLTGDLQSLSPQVQQASTLRTRNAELQKQVVAQEQLARRRQQATLLLRAAAQASQDQIRLQRIVLQLGRAELRGHAASTEEVQAFANAISASGLEGATLHDLHAEAGAYAFSLAVPLPAGTTTVPESAPGEAPR